jgi:hypothetical protein
MLRSIISPKGGKKMLDGGASNILGDIIGGNKKIASPQKRSALKTMTFESKQALKQPKSGGFLDQMKKEHKGKNRGSFYTSGKTTQLMRKKKLSMQFPGQN